MSHKSQSLQNLKSPGSSRSAYRQAESSPQTQPLRHLSISQSPIRQQEQARADSSSHEPDQTSRNPYWGVIKENKKEKRVGSRLTRPSITSNTFRVLDTIAEPESQTQSGSTPKVSDDAQPIVELAVDRYLSHPLSRAVSSIPPIEEQLAKHRDGLFEWILAIRVPVDSRPKRDTSSDVADTKEIRKEYFGCNLLPEPSPGGHGGLKTAHQVGSYLLLVTSLEETEDVLEVFCDPVMAIPGAISGHTTPVKLLDYDSTSGPDESTPHSAACTKGDTSMESIASRSPVNPVTRIEDSFEALDMLEDELEAFDKVARFSQFVATDKPLMAKKPSAKNELAPPNLSVKFATPQPQRTITKPSPASLRVKPASEPQKTALRKATSMNLEPHRFRREDKSTTQHSLKASTPRVSTRMPTQKPVTKPAKERTIPTLKRPGDAVAHQWRDKNDARLAAQRATQPTAASLGRARSAKLPARPAFELPGEAISRRKREEHQAQLKAQEETDKKRREFKARPPPSHTLPATLPRETVASRARQNKAVLAENSAHTTTPTRRSFATVGPHSRSVLSATINQSESRGRGLKVEGISIHQESRATSASTASMSGKRSSLSIEDAHMQKLRGHEIYQRDNLARLARGEAAEKSRQESREWAAKQARKRISMASLRDVLV